MSTEIEFKETPPQTYTRDDLGFLDIFRFVTNDPEFKRYYIFLGYEEDERGFNVPVCAGLDSAGEVSPERIVIEPHDRLVIGNAKINVERIV